MQETTPETAAFTDCALPLRDLTLPPPGAADLWFLDLARLGNPLDPAQPLRPGALRVTHQRTLRRFYLRLLLGAYLGLPGKDVHVSRPARGKPMLDPACHPESLDFSLAASEGCCLVGVTAGAPVGVDLEPQGRRTGRPLALARRYFSDQEVRALAALPEAALDAAFLRTWACKEAYVKAAGLGIANQLRRFTVEAAPGRDVALLQIDDDDAAAWRMAELRPAPAFLGVVTARQPALELRCWRLQPPPGLAHA